MATESCECQPTPPVCQCDETPAQSVMSKPMYSPYHLQQPTYVQVANFQPQYYLPKQESIPVIPQAQPVNCEKKKKTPFKTPGPKSQIVRDGIANNPKNKNFMVKQREALLDYLMNTVQTEDEVVIKGQTKKLRKGSNYLKENFRGSRLRGISKNKKKW